MTCAKVIVSSGTRCIISRSYTCRNDVVFFPSLSGNAYIRSEAFVFRRRHDRNSVCLWKVFSPIFSRPYSRIRRRRLNRPAGLCVPPKTHHYTLYVCVCDFLRFPFETACGHLSYVLEIDKNTFRSNVSRTRSPTPSQSSFEVHTKRTGTCVCVSIVFVWHYKDMATRVTDQTMNRIVETLTERLIERPLWEFVAETAELDSLKLKFESFIRCHFIPIFVPTTTTRV